MTDRTRRFEAAALPHLDAAYNLARWLMCDEDHAKDVVQEAYLRGLKFFDSFNGGDARPWLLAIVRNTCYTWLKNSKQAPEHVEFEEDRDSGGDDPPPDNPETLLMQKQERARLDKAIGDLSPAFREVVVLRELEDLSYEEIAEVAAIPLGTVMSRLARARAMLRSALNRPDEGV